MSRIAQENIRLKRAYESPTTDDGVRVLVDRLWPRGVKKANAAIDRWLRKLRRAPSFGVGSDMMQSAGASFVADIERNWITIPRRSMNCRLWRGDGRSRSSSPPATSCIMRRSCCATFYFNDDVA